MISLLRWIYCLAILACLELLSVPLRLSNIEKSNQLSLRKRYDDGSVFAKIIYYEYHKNVQIYHDQPSIAVARDVCNAFSNDVNMGVCYFNVLNNVKIIRSGIAQRIFEHIYSFGMPIMKGLLSRSVAYQENRHEAELYEYSKMGVNKALLSVYDATDARAHATDSSGNNDAMNIVSICMLGAFSLRSLAAIMSLGYNFKVSYYVDSASYKDAYGMASLFHEFEDVSSIVFKLFHQFKSISDCDVMHIVGADSYYLNYLGMHTLQIYSTITSNLLYITYLTSFSSLISIYIYISSRLHH